MIQNQQTMKLSPYMALYDVVVPKDNMLRKTNELVDFSFIYDELESKYCLDMAPEDSAIEPSFLTKFRKLRLQDVDLLDLLIGKGIIKSRSIIVDSTHTKAI